MTLTGLRPGPGTPSGPDGPDTPAGEPLDPRREPRRAHAHRGRQWPRTVALWTGRLLGLGLVVLALWVGPALSATAGLAALVLLALTIPALAVQVSRKDAASWLVLTVALLYFFQARLVVAGPLNSLGAPATLAAFGALALWASGRLSPLSGIHRGRSPVRAALLVFYASLLMSFCSAMLRPLSADELAGTDRTILRSAALLGVGLLAVDGLRTRERLDAVLKTLVVAVGASAAVGIVAFETGFDFVRAVKLPGLVQDGNILSNVQRADLRRSIGTAIHPIEFGVVLTGVMPLALHFALTLPRGRSRTLCRASLGLMALAVPFTVSRTAILGLVVGLTVYSVALTRRQRLNLLAVGLLGVAALRVVVPGIVGTLLNLFTNARTDSSITARTDDYSRVDGLLEGHALTGRGVGTFLPGQYFILDNQYLKTLLEVGALGVLALGALFIVAASCARGARRRSADPAVRSLGQALAASVCVFAVVAATFDELGFLQSSMTMFLVIGCCGALRQIGLDEQASTDRQAPGTAGVLRPG